MEWGPCIIALKGLHLLTQSHQSSQSQVSSLMPHPAVIVDRVFPGFLRHPEGIVKNFPVFLFCFWNSFLEWVWADSRCHVYASLDTLDSLTQTYQYIGFKILTSQIYSSAGNMGFWVSFTEEGVGLVYSKVGFWNGPCAYIKLWFYASPHLSFPFKQA